MKNKIILTFDLEEFDLPLEYNCLIKEEEQFNITIEGLQNLLDILNLNDVKATFFITGFFCEKYPDSIKNISQKHEIASHAYYHSNFDEEFIIKSKSILESTSGKIVNGFRMPLLQKIDYNNLKQAGYMYDSSINPTYMSGRYNNLRVSRNPYKIGNTGIIELPVSVAGIFRFPLFWLSFKNIPFFIYRFLCNTAFKKDKYIHLYFHPWEFANINKFKIPKYIKSINGKEYSIKFTKLIKYLNKQGEFITVSEFLESCNKM